MQKLKLFERWQYDNKESSDEFEARINEFISQHPHCSINLQDANHVCIGYLDDMGLPEEDCKNPKHREQEGI